MNPMTLHPSEAPLNSALGTRQSSSIRAYPCNQWLKFSLVLPLRLFRVFRGPTPLRFPSEFILAIRGYWSPVVFLHNPFRVFRVFRGQYFPVRFSLFYAFYVVKISSGTLFHNRPSAIKNVNQHTRAHSGTIKKGGGEGGIPISRLRFQVSKSRPSLLYLCSLLFKHLPLRLEPSFRFSSFACLVCLAVNIPLSSSPCSMRSLRSKLLPAAFSAKNSPVAFRVSISRVSAVSWAHLRFLSYPCSSVPSVVNGRISVSFVPLRLLRCLLWENLRPRFSCFPFECFVGPPPVLIFIRANQCHPWLSLFS